MDPARWKRIEELYHAAAARPSAERTAFLEEACGADETLRRELQELLARSTGGGFETPAFAMAAQMIGDPAASMLTGRRLGVYEVDARIGVGGMGEVYKARDTRLGRSVAIKVLPRTFAADPDRLTRFAREARMLAALNHPHIATIYGTEELDGTQGLVLELVEGPTLAERIAQGPLSIKEALAVAQQIAAALEAAHEQGIVHRDLKPANIKFARSGDVKVLDFGLAKAFAGDTFSADVSRLPTVTATELTGMILGTPAYMSPEQARGQAIDKRTDIWAFGCVLFETLTGHPAFPGTTLSDTIAKILEREPDWGHLPVDTPPSVTRLLRRCLEKEPKRRLRDIGDARFELEEAATDRAPVQSSRHKLGAVTRREAISALVGASIGAAAVGSTVLSRSRSAAPRQLARFVLQVPEGIFSASANTRIAISRDGGYLACNPGPVGRFLVRALRELEFKPIEGAERAIPFFSPDSRWLGFNQINTSKIMKVALSGGAPVTICATDNFVGATWADDDVIYFVPEFPSGIAGVPAAGGQPKEIISVDFAKGERQHRFPYALPGGRAVLFTAGMRDSATFDEAYVIAFSPQTGERKVLVEGGTYPRYSPSGHLLYARDAKVFAIRFDPERLETSGEPFQVLDTVLMSRNSGAANYDVSAGGDLTYIPGVCDGGARTLVWVDRNGNAEPVGLPMRSYLHPRFAPDDRQVAIEIEGPNHDVYTYDFDRGVLTNVTTNGTSHWPVWSPDGVQLGYRSGPMSQLRLWRVPANRSRPPEQVRAAGRSQSAESWSPDGKAIAYTMTTSFSSPPAIMVASLDGAEAKVVAEGRTPAGSSKFSPDGRWLAYCSNESGRPEVYVQAYPGPGPKIQVSNEGGTDPVWKRSGGELYYRNGDSMMSVDVSLSPAAPFTAARPRELWKGHYSHGMSSSCGAPGATSSNYDVTADGKRFLMIKDEDQDRVTSKEIVVVQGWADEVNRLSART
jgi:serine/threonine-protein kinase